MCVCFIYSCTKTEMESAKQQIEIRNEIEAPAYGYNAYACQCQICLRTGLYCSSLQPCGNCLCAGLTKGCYCFFCNSKLNNCNNSRDINLLVNFSVDYVLKNYDGFLLAHKTGIIAHPDDIIIKIMN